MSGMSDVENTVIADGVEDMAMRWREIKKTRKQKVESRVFYVRYRTKRLIQVMTWTAFGGLGSLDSVVLPFVWMRMN